MEERVNCKLGDLFEFEYGKGLPKKQRNETGSYPVYGSNGIVGFHDKYLIEGPAIIIGRKGAAGEVAFEKRNLWPIDTTYFVKVPQYLDFMFSFFLLKSLVLSQLDKSTAIPGLNRNDAYNLNINLPPLPEQRAIVSKIEQLFSELENGIFNLKLAQEQLKVYRQAVLKKAFEGYAKVPFSDLVKSSQNGISKRSGKEGSEYKVLRLADISNLEIDYSSPRCIRLTSSEINKYKLFKDDLICIRVNGSKNLVGRLIITSKKDDLNNWAFCDHFIRFSLDLSNAVPKYYYYYFQTMEVRQYIHENMVSSAGQNTVSQGTIKSILVPFSSLPEQQTIVQEIETRLSVCDKIEQDIETNLGRAEALRQSILKKAFEGKLLNEKELAEVRGAEDWEPAEVLLERIKAEKAENGKKGKQTSEQLKSIIQEDKGIIQQATLQAFEQIDK